MGFILFPFALFNKTAVLAEKVLGNVVASVKVMVLAVIVGIGAGLSRSSPPPMAAASRRSSRRSVVLAALAMLGPRRRASLTVCSLARRSLARALLSELASPSPARRWRAALRSLSPEGERWRPPRWWYGDGGRRVLPLQPRLGRSVQRRPRFVRL